MLLINCIKKILNKGDYMYQYPDYLVHHGVKGMRWGYRRARRAAEAASRDASDLRKHGYLKEADAVQKVADKNYKKAKSIAESRLNRNAKKSAKYQEASDRWKSKANAMHESAAKQGPIAYGKAYNRIKQANNNAKQLQKYSNHYTKITNSYIKNLGMNTN